MATNSFVSFGQYVASDRERENSVALKRQTDAAMSMKTKDRC
jgi:hypothetical protein